MTCQLIVNQLTVGHSWPKVFMNDFSTLMGGWHLLNVLSQMQGLCMVQLDLLPLGPGGGALFEAVLSQGYRGGANQK